MADTLVTEGMTTVYAHWAAGCPFTMGGDAAWTQEPDGSWRSGAIANYQETWIATNITGRGTLSFKWKVSSDSVPLMTISFNAVGKPVITTPAEVGTGATAEVIGSSALTNWTSSVSLNRDGNSWTLKPGDSANFFRVRVTKGR